MRSLLGVMLVSACSWFPHRHGYPPPKPPEVPVAIEGINSPFDDFNAASHEMVYGEGIVFSTNRGSEGKNYDLYFARGVWGNAHDGSPSTLVIREVSPFQPQLMSEGDERGPIFLNQSDAPLGSRSRFVFASNREGGKGGLDLYSQDESVPSGPRPLVGINTVGDDAYLTVSPVPRQMLLASNERAGDSFDIYAVTWDEKDNIDNPTRRREVVGALSSDADDTAPFVYFTDNEHRNAEVIFASARPGGLGEHDLYCSRYADQRSEAEREDEERRAKIRGESYDPRTWTEPVLLRELSSARDEYRPMVFERPGARFLVFSSRREGGKGGYDLYLVGYRGCPK